VSFLFRRFLPGRHRADGPTGGVATYRSATYTPLRPWQVRGRLFTRRGRRGVDATEVRDFLDRVADDLAHAHAALAAARAETDRVTAALRHWQSQAHQARLVTGQYR
jgi:DivIVA domain-containing protein